MGGNLAKSPLAAVFYATVFWFLSGLMPFSQTYKEASAGFSMPLYGSFLLLAYALWITVIMALIFSNTKNRGIPLMLFTFLSACGLQWVCPLLRQLFLGETTGAVTRGDTMLWLATGTAATLLLLVLVTLLFTPPISSPDKKKGEPPAPHEPKRKLKVLGLIIRLLVLPVIFMVLYYLIWYFLLWRVDAVREFYGQPERQTFMKEIIDILIGKGFQVVVRLIQGLACVLFSLPLLLQLPGKRVMFIITNTMLYLSGALLYLIPSPFMPSAVRMAHLLETGVLMLVYGVLTAVLLHTVFRRETAEAKALSPGKPGAKPAAKAAPAAKAKDAPAAATGKK